MRGSPCSSMACGVMARPVPAPEPERISPLPRPPKNSADAKFKAAAAVLYRALVARGEVGLSWREAWMVLDENVREEAVGPTIIWMRGKGVEVLATYRAGETVFVLEQVGVGLQAVTEVEPQVEPLA